MKNKKLIPLLMLLGMTMVACSGPTTDSGGSNNNGGDNTQNNTNNNGGSTNNNDNGGGSTDNGSGTSNGGTNTNDGGNGSSTNNDNGSTNNNGSSNSNSGNNNNTPPATPTFERINVQEKYNSDATATNRINEFKVSDLYDGLTHSDRKQYGTNVVYTNKLAEPSHTVNNYNEFADVLDYYAFYGDDSTFEVTLSDTYANANEKSINIAFFASKLCVSVVGLNKVYDATTKTFKIQMLFNENANSYHVDNNARSAAHNEISQTPYTFNSSVAPRAVDFEAFPYLTNRTKGNLDVYNSDQLMYALEFGYMPVIMAGSPAETLMNAAKEFLRGCIYDDMSEREKIYAIEIAIVNNVFYDVLSDDNAAFVVDETTYPEYMASSYSAFYAEGPLLYKSSVCQGFGKAFNILANIEGLTAIKVSGKYTDDESSMCSNEYTYDDEEGHEDEVIAVAYSSHGYSYVLNKEDNKYYICDPTFNYNGVYSYNNYFGGHPFSFTKRICALMTYEDWHYVYSSVIDRFYESHQDIVATGRYNTAQYLKFGNASLYIPKSVISGPCSFEEQAALREKLADIRDEVYNYALTHIADGDSSLFTFGIAFEYLDELTAGENSQEINAQVQSFVYSNISDSLFDVFGSIPNVSNEMYWWGGSYSAYRWENIPMVIRIMNS